MAKTTLILGTAALLASFALGGEAPTDTVYAKYVITRVDTAAFRTAVIGAGQRQTVIVVPPGAGPGDTLLVALIWDGLDEQLQQSQEQVEQLTNDARGLLEKLESLKRPRGEKP